MDPIRRVFHIGVVIGIIVGMYIGVIICHKLI
jgi:hypothetical protein